MNRTDDPLDLVNALKPVILDRLSDEAYARRRPTDLARAVAEARAEAVPQRGRRWPGFGDGGPRVSRRPGWVPAAVTAGLVAVAVLAIAVQAGPGHQENPGHGLAPTAPRVAEPAGTSSRMRLVASESLMFRDSGAGPQADSLDCVTSSVCYVWDTGSEGHGAERTSDGGVTWQQLATLPDGRSLAGQNAGPPSCPTADVCVGAAGGRALAVTADSGARWRIQFLPAPRGSTGAYIDEVSCATPADCVVHLTAGAHGTFLSTVDGGRTWIQATRIPRGAPKYLYYLRCDADGRCIGLAPTGTNADGGIVSVRSDNNGRTWAASASHAPPSAIFMASCGDALHCMLVGDGGARSGVAATMATSDGGLSWHDAAAVSASPDDTPLAVSCATALTCFVSMSHLSVTAGVAKYERAAIEATQDGGRTWSTISLPAAAGLPLAVVFPLSCPSRVGCVAVAATGKQFLGPQRGIISSFPAPSSSVTGG